MLQIKIVETFLVILIFQGLAFTWAVKSERSEEDEFASLEINSYLYVMSVVRWWIDKAQLSRYKQYTMLCGKVK